MPRRRPLTQAQRKALIQAAEIAATLDGGANFSGDPDVLKRAVHWLQDRPEDDAPAWVEVGTVGVDAGMLYLGDPCYLDKTELGKGGDFDAFLKSIAGPDGYLESVATVEGAYAGGHTIKAGMVTTTGYGDGEYPVSVRFKDRRIASVRVDFMGKDE